MKDENKSKNINNNIINVKNICVYYKELLPLRQKKMKRLVIVDKTGLKEKIQSYFEGNEEAKFIHRLHGVLLFAEKDDESCDSIGTLFGNSPRTVSNWIKRINATGDIESLRSKKQQGRPSRLSEEQKQELKQVIQEVPEKQGITSNVWDGNHHAKILHPWLKEVSEVLELFFLPPYSPDLNPIEMLWKKTRRNVTHNRFFESLQALCYDLKLYWKSFALPNDELMKLSAFI